MAIRHLDRGGPLHYAKEGNRQTASDNWMRIFFDVDLTILYHDGAIKALRPFTREVFQRLDALGHQVYVWTATGKAHADRVVDGFKLRDWVTACHDKDGSLDLVPDLIVDDDPYLVEKYSGVWVRPYRVLDAHDRDLLKVLDAVASLEHPLAAESP